MQTGSGNVRLSGRSGSGWRRVKPTRLTRLGHSSAGRWTQGFASTIMCARRSWGAIMDVAGWLRSLGLEQYEEAFRENAIDDTVLPRLTAEDLKDLGVRVVGHRRKLLDAITALRAQASAPTPPLSDAPLAIDKAAKDTAERRQVTVMFSYLVGSTALSSRMDP